MSGRRRAPIGLRRPTRPVTDDAATPNVSLTGGAKSETAASAAVSPHQEHTSKELPRQYRQPERKLETPPGFMGVLWRYGGAWLYQRTSWAWLCEPSLHARYVQLGNELNQLSGVYSVIAVTGSKGGVGKSVVATYLAALAALHPIGRFTLLVDVDPRRGSSAFRFGLKRRVPQGTHGYPMLEFRDYLEQIDKFPSLADLDPYLGRHAESGARVMPSAHNAQSGVRYRLGKVGEALTALSSMVNLTICDCGNNIADYIHLAALKAADIMLFVCRLDMAESLQEARQDIEDVLNRADGTIDPGSLFVVVLNGYESKKADYAALCDWPAERILVVPPDKAMQDTDSVVAVAQLRLQTKIALAETLLATLRQTMRIQRTKHESEV